ncbi:helix-turn-helix domain-containing protein [Pseudomonas sp. MF4836]|uniref:helix-turn-helix domain-containing protein n=1 Tax=Pseudomonas sp. MF4836 TaxID=1960827 RepID=UPI000998C028|nr:AraC family transcriptional regulator [Pseudomonas sp. MF4836]OOV90509.1 AraC family transcriptional regulator [Pseudomonas sp. MF4836]
MSATAPQSFSLAVRSYSGQVELHEHDFHQIVLPQSGSMDIEVDGRGGKVDGSQGVVIAAGARHTFLANRCNSFLVLDVLTQGAQGPKSAAPLLEPLSDKRFFAVRPDIRHLLDYASSNGAGLISSPGMVEPWSRLLLCSLLQPDVAPNHPGQFILARAQAYIERHLSTPMTVRDIARNAGTSERRLYVLFGQHLKTTPFAHIAMLRLNLAIDLLRQTSLSIIEIAHRAGYADQSALTHALKKARNLTPASVRKQAREH